MKEKLEQLCNSIKGVIGYLVTGVVVMLLTAWFTGSAAAISIDKTIDARIDARVEARLQSQVAPTLNTINTKLDYIVSISHDQLLFDIKKQCNKIRSTPDDMKKDDIEYIMARWNTYPEEAKTDYIKAQYEFLKAWYIKHQ